MNVAIIPARGGSKRIPRKNIKLFSGKPILHYSIEAAKGSGCFDEVMVSTDDNEIAKSAKEAGASVPFLRRSETSSDFAGTNEVLLEVIEEYAKREKKFDYICCLLPTAPFVTANRIKQSYQLIRESKADSLIPVVQFSYPIQRAFKITDNRLSMIWPENYLKRSQDLEPSFHDAGQFYWISTAAFLNSKKMLSGNSVPFILDESEVQDIDTEEDWKMAEMKYALLQINDCK